MLAEKARYYRGNPGSGTVGSQELTKPEGYVSPGSIMDDEFDFSQGEELSSDTDCVARSPSQTWTSSNHGGVKMEREVLEPEPEPDMGDDPHVPPLIVRTIQSVRAGSRLFLLEQVF